MNSDHKALGIALIAVVGVISLWVAFGA